MKSNKPIKFLCGKALLVSFCFHLIILNFSIFKFISSAESFRPPLIFIGSILQKEDLFIQKPSGHAETRPLIKAETIILRSDLAETTTFFSPALNKPALDAATRTIEKRELKSLFPTPHIKDKDASQDIYLEGLETNSAPYKPLRILRE